MQPFMDLRSRYIGFPVQFSQLIGNHWSYVDMQNTAKKVFERFFQQALNKGTFAFENFEKNGCFYFPESIFSHFCYLQEIGLNSLQVQQGITDIKKCHLTLFGGKNIFETFYKKQFFEFCAKTVVSNEFWSTPLEREFF